MKTKQWFFSVELRGKEMPNGIEKNAGAVSE